MNKYDVVFTSEYDTEPNAINVKGWTVAEIKELLDSYDDNDIFNMCAIDGSDSDFWIMKGTTATANLVRSHCETNLSHFRHKVECE